MKFRLILLLATGLLGHAMAQNVNDIINLNSPVQMGTPRFVATAGAFTALGNDFSGVHLNPAGLGVFRHAEFSLSMGVQNSFVEADYYGSKRSQYDRGFLFSNIGFVTEIKTNDPNMKVNFGISYNKNNEFNQLSTVSGVNPNSTITEYWRDNANGIPSGDLFGNGYIYEGLAYEAFLLDEDGNNQYSSQAIFGATDQYWQENITGRFDELSFAVSANNDDKLYLGGSVNIPFYKYASAFYYNESGYGGDSINSMDWREDFDNRGFGINIKLGAIYRPTEKLRLGASIFSPSIMAISQSYSTSVTTFFNHSPSFEAAYETEEDFNYTVFTAPQANLGVAYMFNKFGFLSVDYTFLPTNWTRTNNQYLDYLNEDTKAVLRVQHKVAVGAEIKLNKIFLRGGYSWLSNPYENEFQDAARSNVSFGIGYRTNTFSIDLSYSFSNKDYTYYPYDKSYVEPAQQTISQRPFLISTSFRL